MDVSVYLLLTALRRINCPSNTPGSGQCGAVPSVLHLSTTEICLCRVVGEANFKVRVMSSPLATCQDTHCNSHTIVKLALRAFLRRMKSVGDQRGYKELLVIISLELSGNAMMQSLTTDLLGLLRYTGAAFSICGMFIKAVL